MSKNEQAQDSTPPIKKRRKRGVAGKVQAAEIQRFAFDCLRALKKSCTNEQGELIADKETANAVQKLISSWDVATDRLRILRGKGLPSSVKSLSKKSVIPSLDAPQTPQE